jgi:hypothetical protein
MEQKSIPGDLCKTRTEGTTVIVIEYKVDQSGSIFNYFLKENKYPESVVTDNVLCEFEVKGEVKRRYFKEANLELIERTSQ